MKDYAAIGVDVLGTVCSFDLIAHDRFSWLLWFHLSSCKASCAFAINGK